MNVIVVDDECLTLKMITGISIFSATIFEYIIGVSSITRFSQIPSEISLKKV